MTNRCNIRKHHDQPLRGGARYQCEACQDVFPCRHDCEHLDCIVATGRKLPDTVGEEARDALTAELTLLYPDNQFRFAATPPTALEDRFRRLGLHD